MDKLLVFQNKIVPEVIPLLVSRYQILRTIRFLQPVGRRALAEYLHLQERKIRKEVDLLKEQGLIQAQSSGMHVTSDGESLLWEMEDYLRELQGLSDLELKLAKRFAIKKVVVVPGDADGNPAVKQDLARVTADFLRRQLREGSILAVTGGTTLAEVAGALPLPGVRKDVLVLPARGGLGEEVEIQANTVAAHIAKGLGASYRLLHVPDDLQQETAQSIINEPKIKEFLRLLHHSDIVLHGIGSAEEMARRRGMQPREIKVLLDQGAVGEAFGYYFDNNGKVIHATSSVGLQLTDLNRMQLVVAVVGGRNKANAVKAVLSHSPRDILIIDEGAANAILA
ncbi:MAG TPA: sugar-binding domain-containing protein [Bacillota bacterium]|nr:sugar-binding domain-containing protein [Bacillota bacterium]